MQIGKRFIEEHPEIGSLLERLYKKRELDDWYLKKCFEEIHFENAFYNITEIKEVVLRNYVAPDASLYITLIDIEDSDGFCFKQKLSVTVSKLAPVYTLGCFYTLRHETPEDKHYFDFVGEKPETVEMKKVATEVTNTLNAKGYIQLSESHDFYDTVYEWHELPNLEPFGRRLTVGEALFFDHLGLCPK